MARPPTGRYKQVHLGASSKTAKELDAFRQPHESWEKFFRRIIPVLTNGMIKCKEELR